MDRVTIARTESNSRSISLDDSVLFSAALGVSFTQMVATPVRDTDDDSESPVLVAPTLSLPARLVRRWIRGIEPLRQEDMKVFLEEVAAEEWATRHNRQLSLVMEGFETLVDVTASSSPPPDAAVHRRYITAAVDHLLNLLEQMRIDTYRNRERAGQPWLEDYYLEEPPPRIPAPWAQLPSRTPPSEWPTNPEKEA